MWNNVSAIGSSRYTVHSKLWSGQPSDSFLALYLLQCTASFTVNFMLYSHTSLNVLFSISFPILSFFTDIQQAVCMCLYASVWEFWTELETLSASVCVCVRLCVWNGSRNHSDSVNVPLMLCLLTSALVFVLLSSLPHLLPSLLCSSHNTFIFSPFGHTTNVAHVSKTLPLSYVRFMPNFFPSLHLL